MKHRYKILKTLLIIITTIIIIVVVVISFISPITKYLVEKYDEKYTGRQITMSRAYVNPFTGYIHFSNLKIYELKSDSVFFSAKGISANFAILKFLKKTIEITEITLDQPKGIVIQSKKDLNFNDLIKKFTPKKTAATPSKFHFNILGIKIKDGIFYYHEKLFPINYYIKNVNIESPGKWWDSDTMAVQFSFFSGPASGDMKGDFTVNFKNKDYRLAIVVHKFDLKIIEQYLKELTNHGSFSASLDADMKSRGNFNDEEAVTTKGMLAINDFHFGKNPDDDLVSFDKLMLAINEMSPKKYKYFYDSITLTHPYIKYERYDYLDNIQAMFGKNGTKITATATNPGKFNLVIEIAKYVQVLQKNFFQSNYKINRLAIYKGNIKFNDYSINEKFSIDLNPLYIIADSINKNHNRVDVSFKSGIRPFGNVSITLGISPKTIEDFEIQYHLQKLPVSMFNPYLITYTSFPLDRGTIELNGIWNVKKGNIQSNNHVVITDPRVVSRWERNKAAKWLPLRSIMSLIRENGNVIDFEIPITGSLNNPKFQLHDVIFDVLENIFVKSATAPYRIKVKSIETEIEESLTLKWALRHNGIGPEQEKFIERMADFLADNPAASLTVYPQQYAIKEKEYILFFEAKKKFFLITHNKNTQSFSEEDSENVEKMPVKDSFFVHYLNKMAKGSMTSTIQEKCALLINQAIINAKFKQLNKERENAFMFYFKKKEVVKQIKISPAKNIIPYNGFSFYKIEYKGELPKSLLKAYRKMNDLNDDGPRKKYEKQRKKIKSPL